MVSWPTPKAGRNHAAIEEPTSRSSPHFGHGGLLNTILPGVEIISSCHVLPQSGHSNFRGRIETLGCITVFDELRRKKVGFFAFSSSWSRKRNAGVVRNAFNLLKWCFNHAIPARSPHSGSECKSSNGSPRPGVHLTILCRSISPIREVLEFTEVSHLNSIFRTDVPAEVHSLHRTASQRVVGPTASHCCQSHTER